MQAVLDRIDDPSDFYYDPNLVLYLPLHKLDGTSFMSQDHYGHLIQNNGTLWRPDGREFGFGGVLDDYMVLNDGVATSPLNFTSEDFSMIFRIKPTLTATFIVLVCRGAFNVDGYYLEIGADGLINFITCQSGASQTSRSSVGDIVTNTQYTLGISRRGAAVTIFLNGVNKTVVSDTHINPTTCARTANIGIYDDLTSYPMEGKMKVLAVWNRALSALEHMNTHQALMRQVP